MKQIKKNKNKKIVAAAMSLSLATLLLVGGTLAWYITSNTAEGSIKGNAAKVENMKVGIVNLGTTEGFTADAKDNTIYWCDDYGQEKQDAFNSALDGFVKKTNSKNNFTPVTTGVYSDETAEISLLNAPTELSPTGTTAAVDKYIEYTLAFETLEASTPIYFNRSGMDFSSTGSTASAINALRVGVTDITSAASKVSAVLAPMYTEDTTTGSTNLTTVNVGGKLDLNGDGCWDYKTANKDGKLTNETVWYGTHSGELTQEKISNSEDMQAPIPNSNDNSFTGKYVSQKNDTYKIDVMGAEGTAETQVAHGMDYFTYIAGDETNHPIATSNEEKIAKINVKIWIEGWDVNCLNTIMSAQISTTLAFVAPTVTK